ncbi:heavy metal sensor histidine kinase [Diaphorobacter aerolatus]|uniref:Sensor protein n=1 Tax=Diaphorobacter aerolatus TaxID=1288495 RepID=A0A7H0GPG7_9BURK|nr:heavy metal sensor histidine kinase [Diaphorobacter aerolatus]QNP50183.1 heavy metal sensor histidine kinase [Diaphorobacter aerolatus]
MSLPKDVPHLGRRLSRWMALLSLLGLGAVGTVVYLVFDTTLSARQREMLDQKQQALVHVLADDNVEHKDKSLDHMLTDFLAGHSDYAIRIVDASGANLFDSRIPGLSREHTLERTFPVKIASLKSDHMHDAVATLVMDRRPDDVLLRALGWTLFISMIAGSTLLSFFGGLLVRGSLRPIQSLVTQISELSAKDFERRLDGSGLPQELLPIVTQFNALLDRLADAYRQLESFNADVAHELNTPLATLISSSEVVLRKPRPVEEMREVLESNLEDLRRIAGIVGDMLFLSRADRGVGARETKMCSLATVANEVVEFYEAVALDADLTIEVRGDAQAQIDAPLIRRAVSNLLSNATRYATGGSNVVIQIAESSRNAHTEAILSVTNVGVDIEQHHLRHLFDRFYRADSSRHNVDRNHGLGLAIVKGIAKMHGGTVFAQSEGGTTTFGLILPQVSPDEPSAT